MKTKFCKPQKPAFRWDHECCHFICNTVNMDNKKVDVYVCSVIDPPECNLVFMTEEGKIWATNKSIGNFHIFPTDQSEIQISPSEVDRIRFRLRLYKGKTANE